MTPSSTPRYDTITILLHWLVAIIVAVLWTGGETLSWVAPGATRADLRSLHILLGCVLGVVGAVRFIWRLSFGRPLPPVDSGAVAALAKLTHRALYALLAAMVFIGMMLLWATGDSAFNAFTLPANDAADAAFAVQLQHIHAIIGWVIVAAVGLHSLAVLFHHFVLRDATLARMGWGGAGRRT